MFILFETVPFLNGGLFECLDYMKEDQEKKALIPICVDGFSREESRRAVVPNILFFGEGKVQKGKRTEEVLSLCLTAMCLP
jgi:hypothetical protein